jgi:hypothetical protein
MNEVRAGYLTRNNLLKTFLDLFPGSPVTLNQWIAVMGDISAHFDVDDNYHAYIESLWNFRS